MFFDGHDEQLAEMPNPGGQNYNEVGGGDQRGEWGGKGATPGRYTGAWVHDPNSPSIPKPADYDQWYRETAYRPSGREMDVNRYREMGNQLANRGAYQLDYGKADEAFAQGQSHRQDANVAREQQRNALYLTGEAAKGNAPSRAELLGRGLIDQSLKANLAGGASARGGPLAQMAAQRQAMQGSAAFRAAGMNQLSALRADEMERNRAAYAKQAGDIRAQDYLGENLAYGMAGTKAGMTQAQGQLEYGQRQMNQSGQLAYEGMGWDTNNAALQAGLGRSGMEANAYENAMNRREIQADRDQRQGAAVMSAAGGGFGAILDYSKSSNGGRKSDYSDMRAKKPAPLMLDLGGGRQPKGATPSWLSSFMDPATQARDAKHARDEHDERLEQIDAPNIHRDDPYPTTTPGDIQREDPYGTEEVFFSDERAKRDAFQEGVTYGERTMAGEQPAPPDYVKPKTAGAPGTAKPLLIDRPRTASSIDPRARGEKPPPAPPPDVRTLNTGDRPFERGRPANIGEAPRERRDVTGREGWPGGEAPMAAPKPRPASPPAPAPTHPFEREYNHADQGGGKASPHAMLREDANRRQAGFPYTYKEDYRPDEQQAGELNYGFSAQELEKNPITATAVQRDPNGMRRIDTNKLMKVQSDSIASLQEQLDELKYGGRRG